MDIFDSFFRVLSSAIRCTDKQRNRKPANTKQTNNFRSVETEESHHQRSPNR